VGEGAADEATRGDADGANTSIEGLGESLADRSAGISDWSAGISEWSCQPFDPGREGGT
jgi:hypothetical protein